ncbi:MAG TPA: helix-turn-helix domain-containing protein [Thermoplasmata archaeon]|nr:helix-turn-helix domain-containing protein [Thermoplasmata archaeon]
MQKLEGFGLTEYQARVYLALLDLGTATASEIPAISRVPRTRIYTTVRQLHAKGLVQILPERPVRYQAVPFSRYLKALATEYRQKAVQIAANADVLAEEFSVTPLEVPTRPGRFEAIYGRRNVRNKLVEMYEGAETEIIGIGSTHSPARILHGLGQQIEEKAALGLTIKFAFFTTPDNEPDIAALSRHSEIRHIDFFTPVCRHGVDGQQFLMSHPIPDDDSGFRGEDIAIWTDDPAIAAAMAQMAERIWEMGKRTNPRPRESVLPPRIMPKAGP